MNTEHERLSKLYQDDPAAFEKELDRLITEAIKEAPEEKQESLKEFQTEIDHILDRAGSNRMEVLEVLMQVKFKELSKELIRLQSMLEKIKIGEWGNETEGEEGCSTDNGGSQRSRL